MKTCTACEDQFDDKFSYCPVDGTPLNSLAAALAGYSTQDQSISDRQKIRLPRLAAEEKSYHYEPTILSSSGLLARLGIELQFLKYRFRKAWPELKSDPLTFTKSAAVDLSELLRERFGARDFLSGVSTALFLVLAVVVLVLLFGHPTQTATRDPDESPAEIVTLSPLNQSPIPFDKGIGTGSKGRVGFNHGKGEGSEAKPKRAQGGGTGGGRDPLSAQKGGIPQASEIPAPIPKLPPERTPSLPDAGIDIDPALWKHLPFPVYGDPRSKSTTPSNGPGDGGGIGDRNGLGIGEGKGNGFGPGSDGNMGDGPRQLGCCGIGGGSGNDPYDPDHIFSAAKVGQRVRVLAKPEPQYTDEARKNQITGTVVLRVVFSRSGEVTNIRAVQSLPFGLTEKAIVAARQIRFSPAIKDGRAVSVYMQLEYNFNLY